MKELDFLQRYIERETNARKQAEALLEQKSRDLYTANEEMRKSAEALKEQSERAAAIVDNAAEGIVTYGEQGIIDSFNPAAEKIFDLSADQAIGRAFDSLFKETDFAENETFEDDSSEHTRQLQMGVKADGTEFPVDVVTSSVVVREKQINTVIIRDMTHRFELERQLTQAQKLESIGQLAAGIAHEINTPIQYVGDNTRFLCEAFEDLEKLMAAYAELEQAVQGNAELQPHLEKVSQVAEEADLEFLRDEIPSAIQQSIDGTSRVAEIVRAMKDFAHPSQQEKTAIDINRAIESSTTVCRNEWKYVADLELCLDESLPMVDGLASELNQAILNLVVNGAHAIQDRLGDKSTEKGTITVTSRRNGQSIEVLITDTGTGIPEEIRQKIFDPFFTTKGVGRGTGQGLAITYNAIVEKHGGELLLDSVVGEGSTFTIRLPMVSEKMQQENQ